MTIQIEEGKFYRNRMGAMFGPMTEASRSPCAVKECTWVVRGEEDVAYHAWRRDGTWHVGRREVPMDLIEQVPVHTIEDVKVGQKWRWLGNMSSTLYTVGRTYEVMSIGVRYINMEDNDGRTANDGEGHYWPKETFLGQFSLAEPDPLLRAMVEDDIVREPTPDIKTTIADEAKRIVSGARRSAYGKPEQNFERIARFWQAYFENTGRGDVKITAADVSPLMRLMKEARLAESPNHYDSFVDLIGYTLTGAEVNGVSKPT